MISTVGMICLTSIVMFSLWIFSSNGKNQKTLLELSNMRAALKDLDTRLIVAESRVQELVIKLNRQAIKSIIK